MIIFNKYQLKDFKRLIVSFNRIIIDSKKGKKKVFNIVDQFSVH